jgi:vacuolar-type H+-ATPase subunit E/Vma4
LDRIQQETDASMKTITRLADEEAKKIKEESNNAGNVIESSTNKGLDRIQQEADASLKTITRLADEEAKKIKEGSIDDKEEQYITARKSKFSLLVWHYIAQSLDI